MPGPDKSMTVGELKGFLMQYPDSAQVFINTKERVCIVIPNMFIGEDCDYQFVQYVMIDVDATKTDEYCCGGKMTPNKSNNHQDIIRQLFEALEALRRRSNFPEQRCFCFDFHDTKKFGHTNSCNQSNSALESAKPWLE